jgi:hypothetical protein
MYYNRGSNPVFTVHMIRHNVSKFATQLSWKNKYGGGCRDKTEPLFWTQFSSSRRKEKKNLTRDTDFNYLREE